MDLDFVRNRHCVPMYTLLISYHPDTRVQIAYLASNLKSPNGGIIALPTIQL